MNIILNAEFFTGSWLWISLLFCPGTCCSIPCGPVIAPMVIRATWIGWNWNPSPGGCASRHLAGFSRCGAGGPVVVEPVSWVYPDAWCMEYSPNHLHNRVIYRVNLYIPSGDWTWLWKISHFEWGNSLFLWPLVYQRARLISHNITWCEIAWLVVLFLNSCFQDIVLDIQQKPRHRFGFF